MSAWAARCRIFLSLSLAVVGACGGSLRNARMGDTQAGDACWYGRAQHGGPTASGERFNMYELTAAHRSLRMGSLVRVENLRNHQSVVVRINDRGPFTRGRIIDLSYAAAQRISMVREGVVPVRLLVMRVP